MEIKGSFEKVVTIDVLVTVAYTVFPVIAETHELPAEGGPEIDAITMQGKDGKAIDVAHLIHSDDVEEMLERASEDAMGGDRYDFEDDE